MTIQLIKSCISLTAAVVVVVAIAIGEGIFAEQLTTTAGSSFVTAIRVPAKTEREGTQFERRYIGFHYPGARLLRQRVGNHRGHVYDIMTIVTAGGKHQSVYFDITSYFGRL